MPFTPMQIHGAIVYWTHGKPAEALGYEHFNSHAGKDVLAWLCNEKLIVWDGERHVPQERLGVFVEHLCAQPLPVQHWVMPG